MTYLGHYEMFSAASALVGGITGFELAGRVSGASAALIMIEGLGRHLSVGTRVMVCSAHGHTAVVEVVQVTSAGCSAMPVSFASGIRIGDRVLAPPRMHGSGPAISPACLGRVVGPDGRAIDGHGTIAVGAHRGRSSGRPIPAAERMPLGEQMASGIAAVDLFIPCRFGQRLGIFAGTGVGKSSLLSRLAACASYDVVVVALIGERGREVKEVVTHLAASNRMRQAIVVVATSDMTGFEKRDAAHTAVAAAEYFRRTGSRVLLLFDSVSRYCDALREIALAGGELPAAMGFPPSVFQVLARMLERIGPGAKTEVSGGAITGIFTALLDESDEVNPVADAVRGMLDGHVFLRRRLANRGHFPAIDVLSSISRCAAGLFPAEDEEVLRCARMAIAAYEEAQDSIAAGLYRRGEDPSRDQAIATGLAVMSFLRQAKDIDAIGVGEALVRLRELIVGQPRPMASTRASS